MVDVLLGLGAIELSQDRLAPERSLCAKRSHRQQVVTLQARPEHAGIEDGGEHPVILAESGWTIGLTLRMELGPGPPESLREHVGVLVRLVIVN